MNEMPLARFFADPSIPGWFKAVVFVGLPFVFLGSFIAAMWLLSRFTHVFTAAYISFLAAIFVIGIIAVARRKLKLKHLLGGLLILGWPLLFASVVRFFLAY